jgi:NADPH-dependent glutamate synthase beta subunit-like oxidoreductase
VVIGAGNTAMDCLRVARRLGVTTVRCVYRRSEVEAPSRVEELRHAREEGVEFFFLHAPIEILLDVKGDVRGMRAQRMALGEPDERGRRKPLPLEEYVELECDTVIYALGTKPNPIIGQATPGLERNRWGNICADEHTQCTNLPGVYAGGDIVTGGATVILAMGAGRRAAKAIGAWLQAGKSKWPISAEEVAAFVAERAASGKSPDEAGSANAQGAIHAPKTH